jgi:hypothetical protein
MANSSSERLKFTKEQFLEALCRSCKYPDNPATTCSVRRDGWFCQRCIGIAKVVCKKTSLENESIFENT